MRVTSLHGRTSLAYTARPPKQLPDGAWVVKLERRTGWISLSRVKEVVNEGAH